MNQQPSLLSALINQSIESINQIKWNEMNQFSFIHSIQLKWKWFQWWWWCAIDLRVNQLDQVWFYFYSFIDLTHLSPIYHFQSNQLVCETNRRERKWKSENKQASRTSKAESNQVQSQTDQIPFPSNKKKKKSKIKVEIAW